jgi:hypothetical protein
MGRGSIGRFRELWGLLPAWLLLGWTLSAYGQDLSLRSYSFPTIGLAIGIPENWAPSELVTTTRAQFFAKFGWNYRGDDAEAVWSAFGSFSHVDVDSSLVPADSAYSAHFLTLFVERSPTMYKKWLCRLGRRSLMRDIDEVKAGTTVLSERRLPAPSPSADQAGVYGIGFVRVAAGSRLPTVGRLYTFVHREKCYSIKIESTSARSGDNERLHDRMFRTLQLVE